MARRTNQALKLVKCPLLTIGFLVPKRDGAVGSEIKELRLAALQEGGSLRISLKMGRCFSRATAGSVIGAYLTFRLGRRAGAAYRHSKFGHRKLDAILNFFHKWGTSALAVSTAVPIPMPTSMLFAAAGASDYGVGRFRTVVIICRSVRYTFIAIVADHYGRHFVRVLRHPSQYWGWLLLFAAVIFSLIMAGILLNRRLTAATTG